MSWPGDSRENEFRTKDEPLPLHPGSGRPPHHSRSGGERPRKRTDRPPSVTWSIDVSEGRQSPDSDRWTRHVDPLPEPQTDVPVFSVAAGERSLRYGNQSPSSWNPD